MRLHLMLCATALATATALSGCGSGATTEQAGASGEQLDVVVSAYPYQFVAERVGGAEAKVTNLTQPGAEPHDLELSPQQIASLTEADVVIYQSGFQPAVDEAIAQAQPKRVLDIAKTVPLHPGNHDHTHGDAESAAPADGHADEGHTEDGHTQDGHTDAGAGHDHSAEGGLDPHVWLDPQSMVTIAEAMNRELAAAAPERGDALRTNTQALTGDLTGLDKEFSDGLRQCERREFITSHDAFGYLAERYQLTQIPIRGLSPDAEPTPARIAEVQQLARDHGVTTIFYETLVSPAVAQSIGTDLKLKTEVLDPLEGLTPDSKGSNYIEVMESNLSALKAANACQ